MTDNMLNGAVLIADREVQTESRFHGIEATTGAALSGDFSEAGGAEVDKACVAAAECAAMFADIAPGERADFLETIAEEIEADIDMLVERGSTETGLPAARLTGETGRTAGQLRMFARVLREGSWAGRVIDPAMPDRTPLPRPDLRQRRLALGPVAVFGASNFPLAFSVAGGDTASALAAGCPVIVKGHPGHPGTGEIVARAIRRAVAKCSLPAGVFSYLPGSSHDLGGTLVKDPRITAVGFTGSRAGGLALAGMAAQRAVPIPVYAELSAVNPVILFPNALASRGDALAKAYVGSLSMGCGQFCTNPGIVLAVEGPDLDTFLSAATEALKPVAEQTMLTPGIGAAYAKGIGELSAHDGVELVATGEGDGIGQAALLRTTGQYMLNNPAVSHELFGPSSLVVACESLEEIAQVLHGLEGQLTATLQIDEEDEVAAAALMPILERTAGRILANGWPTGVEVCDAMVHGGPFPATTDSRTTSVGTAAIERFLRPVCYQGLPDSLLPKSVDRANSWNLPERVDGIRRN